MKIHLIGIAGTGMGALAGLLREARHEVRGSDNAIYPPMSTLLQELSIPVFEGYAAKNLDWKPDLVVVGNTCKRDHLEVLEAQARGFELISFPALLRRAFLEDRHSIVIAGTHGKTTTTSLMAHLLTETGHDPGYLIGGVANNFGRSFHLGKPPYFVVEGDEYDCAFFDKRPKFVHYNPQTVILTSLEFDHADIYASIDDVEAAFALLIEQVPQTGRIIVCADYPRAVALCTAKARCDVITYSLTQPADWTASLESTEGEIPQRWNVRARGTSWGTIELAMSGNHNIANALSVVCAATELGISSSTSTAALKRFKGIKRRQEVRGVVNGITVIDDFAHHPTAISETVSGLKKIYPKGNMIAVFEPRSATSRRRVFQHDFPKALALADRVVLAPLYAPEKLPEAERLDVDHMVAEIKSLGTDAVCLPTVDAIIEHLISTTTSGDTVVVMSSGGFGGLIEKLLAKLEMAQG